MSFKNTIKSSQCLSNISAIFFDLDNTLIPTRKGDVKACKKLCDILQEQYGLSHEDADNCTSTFLRSFRSCPDNSQTTLDSWRSYLWSEALPINLKHLNLKIYEQWLNLRYRYLSLTSENEDILKRLRKTYLLALITNGPSNAQWEKIHKLNLSKYFDCILVSSDLPWEKPNPNIFLTACNILNVKPSQCVMIGDKIETDIKGAKDAKLAAAIWLPLNQTSYNHTNNDDNNDDVPDIKISNLMELLKYIPVQSATTTTTTAATATTTAMTTTTLNTRRRRSFHNQITSKSSSVSTRRYPIYKRVTSLPEFDGYSDNNSLDSNYS